MPITVDEVAVDALAESLGISDSTARAALLLDEVAPGWMDHIDLDSLDMMSVDRCIIGQLVGVHPFFQGRHDYTQALYRLGDELLLPATIENAYKYNFSHSSHEYVTLINARRALVGA